MSTRTSRDDFDRQQVQGVYDQIIENYRHWQRISRRATYMGLALSMLWIVAWGIAAIFGGAVTSIGDAIPLAVINAIANLPAISTWAARKQMEAILSVQTANKISDPKLRDETLAKCALAHISNRSAPTPAGDLVSRLTSHTFARDKLDRS